jgi:hypothetical protein
VLLAEAVLLFVLPASPRWLLAQQTPASKSDNSALLLLRVEIASLVLRSLVGRAS